MKKIFYIVSLAILVLFTSCDYNATNFPGFDKAAIPTKIATITYTFASADYITIGSSFTKVSTDSVSSLKTQLKAATTKTDSATINAKITRINSKLSTDSTLVAAANISTNKIFGSLTQARKLIPLVLNTKYPYVDANSSAAVNYNLSYDTTKIAVADKYTFLTADYELFGTTATTQPGKNHDFSSTINPDNYLPIFLKSKYPFAVKGDIKLIRYKYYISSTSIIQIGGVYIYDGTNWVNYNSSSQVSKTFVFRGGKWLDLVVFKEGFTKDVGTFTQQQVVGTYLWYWGSYNGGCMQANAYNKGVVESWLVSPAIDLKDRINPTLSFDEAMNYGAGLTLSDLANVYISTDDTNDVTKATWVKLPITYPTTFSFTFFNSGKLSLLPYINKKVNVGFKYVSTGTAM